MTELARNEKGVAHRTGQPRVAGTVAWRRKVGGRYGVTVGLPAGAYSDDTQLRLATSRAIRGRRFDIRAFTKIELPVWLAYSLGAGRSSTIAAGHASRQRVHWFNNHYRSGTVDYFEAGGNGAAMRIQPHVWAATDASDTSSFMGDVLKNAVATHGHPRGFVGAVFHAACLAFVLDSGDLPGPEVWPDLASSIQRIPSWIAADEELAGHWLPAWETKRRQAVGDAVGQTIEELSAVLRLCREVASGDGRVAYEEMTLALRATLDSERGSALKTSALGLALAWLGRDRPADALIEAVNVLGTDTDTIATMAGSLLGAALVLEPPGTIQDRDYLEREAARVARGEADSHSYRYPDRMKWKPPATGLDAVGSSEGRLALLALGPVEPEGQEWKETGLAPAVLQWLRTDFGQTVLARRRPTPQVITPDQWGRYGANGAPEVEAPTLFSVVDPASSPKPDRASPNAPNREPEIARTSIAWMENSTVEQAFDQILKARFEPALIGKLILELSTRAVDGHAQAMALSAMVAKAWRSRQLRP